MGKKKKILGGNQLIKRKEKITKFQMKKSMMKLKYNRIVQRQNQKINIQNKGIPKQKKIKT